MRDLQILYHTQLTLITLKWQQHDELVSCQPAYMRAKASLPVITDRSLDFIFIFLNINQPAEYINPLTPAVTNMQQTV